jgi:hypothetical protein
MTDDEFLNPSSQFNNEITQYPVRVWEMILIVMGAIALIGAAVVGLGIKVLNNAYSPIRAEAIAKSLIDYRIPGGSQGVFGINIGSAKLAWVQSNTNPPDVILFVGRAPVNKETDQSQANRGFDQPPTSTAEEQFTVTNSRVENRYFCGSTVPVTIETGQQTLTDNSSTIPAIRYTVRTTENNFERIVVLVANGNNASEKADNVFNSLRCN